MGNESLAKDALKKLPIKTAIAGGVCLLIAIVAISRCPRDRYGNLDMFVVEIVVMVVLLIFAAYCTSSYKEYKYISKLLGDGDNSMLGCYEQNRSELFSPLKTRPGRIIDYINNGDKVPYVYLPISAILYLYLAFLAITVQFLITKDLLQASLYCAAIATVFYFLGLSINQVLFLKAFGYKKKNCIWFPLVAQFKFFIAIPIIFFFQMNLVKKGYYLKGDTSSYVPIGEILALQILSVKGKYCTHYQLNLIFRNQTRECVLANDFLYHIVEVATKISNFLSLPIVTEEKQLLEVSQKDSSPKEESLKS